MTTVRGGTKAALQVSPSCIVPQGDPSDAVPAVDEYVPARVELSKLIVPLKVNVCVPATAVRLMFWPLMVPVTAAEPLLQTVEGVGEATEKAMLPVNELLSCTRNPP